MSTLNSKTILSANKDTLLVVVIMLFPNLAGVLYRQVLTLSDQGGPVKERRNVLQVEI